MNYKSKNKWSYSFKSAAPRRRGLQQGIEHAQHAHAKHLPANEALVELDALADAAGAVPRLRKERRARSECFARNNRQRVRLERDIETHALEADEQDALSH